MKSQFTAAVDFGTSGTEEALDADEVIGNNIL